jgi:hypothetical protein
MSKIEVNAIEPQCGTNLTVGASGDTITFPSGTTVVNNGSQTGFGRTGTVDWDTTAKTASFTAVSGNGYFVNTTSGAVTVTLPASPSAGDIVSIADYTNTFQTNNVTVARNGSPIGGIAADAILSTEGLSVTFVYVDGTEGWKNINDATSNTTGNPNLVATGGTITCCGDYRIHTFTGPGTFTVLNTSTTPANNTVSYMVVAGGGGGGDGDVSGGGGAGGFREYKGPSDCYTASPLNGNPGGTAVTVTAQAYPITVGGGGAAGSGSANGSNGANSVFSTIISAGGGGGANGCGGPAKTAGSGGSGGGKNYEFGTVGSGNTPPVSPPQGNPGGGNADTSGSPAFGAGGGGGATATGGNGSPSAGGSGGAGATTNISASPVAYAGGGGGARNDPGTQAPGGTGGGGIGGNNGTNAGCGTTNTGGGGGGLDNFTPGGGNGGSGIVIIRYKYQ